MARQVLVTRSAADCAELQALVLGAGVTIRPYPVLRPAPADDPAGWAALLERLPSRAAATGSWLALTSPRAPRPFVEQSRQRGAGHLLELPAAAVGEGTAAAAEAAGLDLRLVGHGTGADLAAALAARLEPGAPVVLPAGRDRRPELPAGLAAAGHPVLAVEVYRMQPTPSAELPQLPPTSTGWS